MGFIRPMTNDDILSFQEAADTTSKQLADMWETFLSCQNQYLDSIHNSTEQKTVQFKCLCMLTYPPTFSRSRVT